MGNIYSAKIAYYGKNCRVKREFLAGFFVAIRFTRLTSVSQDLLSAIFAADQIHVA